VSLEHARHVAEGTAAEQRGRCRGLRRGRLVALLVTVHSRLEVIPVAVVERQLDVRVGLLGARVGADEHQLVVVAVRLHLAAVQRVVHQQHGRRTGAAGGAALVIATARPVPTAQLQARTLRGTCRKIVTFSSEMFIIIWISNTL
jgi:hypothetical protein